MANPYWSTERPQGKKRAKQMPRTYESKEHYDSIMATAPATKLKTLIEVLKYHLEDDSLPALKVNQSNYELVRGDLPEESKRSLDAQNLGVHRMADDGSRLSIREVFTQHSS